MAPGLRTDLKAIFVCLSKGRRRELGLLMLLMPATALAEALTVAAVLPFIALLSGQPVKPPLDPVLEFLPDWELFTRYGQRPCCSRRAYR